ncbi:MAG: hypothetical protein NTU97_00520, partial [Candidatus Magasanikbacteria bacterium]|nr:hypothetical protein [Candidatus Magasanikbacteria bacterium]
KMNFGDFTLRLDPESRHYWVDNRRVNRTCVSLAFILPRHGEIVVGPDQNDVEIALARFVKNDAVVSLVIQLEEGNVYLRKVAGIRGQLEAVIILKSVG